MAKRSMYPAPVYEAHFADGRVIRTTFYTSRDGEIDFKRGARTAAMVRWKRHLTDVCWRTMRPDPRDYKTVKAFKRARREHCAGSRAFFQWHGQPWSQSYVNTIISERWSDQKPKDWIGEGTSPAGVIVDGYIFSGETYKPSAGRLLGRDPRFKSEAKYPCNYLGGFVYVAPRVTAVSLKALLKRVLADDAAAIEQARRLVA